MKTLKSIGELCLVFVLLFLLMYANGCKECRHYSKKTHQTVTVYKTHKHDVRPLVESDDDEWIYWYIFSEDHTLYYYSSPNYYTPAQYQTMQWTPAKENPIPAEEMASVQTVEEQTVSNDELGPQMEQTIDTTEQQIADMVDEGNPNSSGYDTDSNEGGNDSGGTDSGSSGDSGGGDSGGGDGGGGGD